MPVYIGATLHDFGNPIGLLSDCHRRIEMFLGSLEAVAAVIDRPLSEEAVRALTTALQYFREAAPKHTADEEESLFPRLRLASRTEVESALEQVEQLEKDHRWATSLHADVDRLGQRYLSNAELSLDEVEQFRAAVGQLALMYRQHIRVEDNAIFPLASRLLSQDDRDTIAREMAARRNVVFAAAAVHIHSPE
jgi:hemerythrin-like domain-containing protein